MPTRDKPNWRNRRRRSLPPWLAAAILLAAAGAWWFWPQPEPVVVALPVIETSSPAEDWRSVLSGLDRCRSQALHLRDPSLLSGCSAEQSPAWLADRELIAELIAAELVPAAVVYEIVEVVEESRRWSAAAEFVTLRVVDARAGYRQESDDGLGVEVPARGEAVWAVTLRRTDATAPWLLFESVALDSGERGPDD